MLGTNDDRPCSVITVSGFKILLTLAAGSAIVKVY